MTRIDFTYPFHGYFNSFQIQHRNDTDHLVLTEGKRLPSFSRLLIHGSASVRLKKLVLQFSMEMIGQFGAFTRAMDWHGIGIETIDFCKPGMRITRRGTMHSKSTIDPKPWCNRLMKINGASGFNAISLLRFCKFMFGLLVNRPGTGLFLESDCL